MKWVLMTKWLSLLYSALFPLLLFQSEGLARSGPFKIPLKFQQILKQHFPTFVPFQSTDYLPSITKYYTFTSHQYPSMVRGDFNGDHLDDLIIEGKTPGQELLIAILSNEDSFKVRVLEKQPLRPPPIVEIAYQNGGKVVERGRFVYLSLQKKATVDVIDARGIKQMTLPSDAYVVNYFAKAAIGHYINHQQIEEFYLGD